MANSEHHFINVAKRKANKEGWEPYLFETLDNGILVTGSVPVGVYTRGLRKGMPKWDRKLDERFFVSREEIKQEELRYVNATGKCHKCWGKGCVVKSISTTEGITYRDCRHCNGTGKATGQGGGE